MSEGSDALENQERGNDQPSLARWPPQDEWPNAQWIHELADSWCPIDLILVADRRVRPESEPQYRTFRGIVIEGIEDLAEIADGVA